MKNTQFNWYTSNIFHASEADFQVSLKWVAVICSISQTNMKVMMQ